MTIFSLHDLTVHHHITAMKIRRRLEFICKVTRTIFSAKFSGRYCRQIKNLRAASCTRLALYIQPICFYLPFLIDVCYTRNLINADQPSLMCQTKCLSLQSLLCWYYLLLRVAQYQFFLINSISIILFPFLSIPISISINLKRAYQYQYVINYWKIPLSISISISINLLPYQYRYQYFSTCLKSSYYKSPAAQIVRQ